VLLLGGWPAHMRPGPLHRPDTPQLMNVEKALAEKHYADLASKPFFPALVDYIVSGPVVAMVWEGKGVVTTGRKMIGATNPLASEPGTIRGDFAIEVRAAACGGTGAELLRHARTAPCRLWAPAFPRATAPPGSRTPCAAAKQAAASIGWPASQLRRGATRPSAARSCGGTPRPLTRPPSPPAPVLPQVGRNVIHGSDSVENGKKEIALWFGGESRAPRQGVPVAEPESAMRRAKPARRLCGCFSHPATRAAPCAAGAPAADLCEWTPAAKPWIYE
jgi:nucleoside diphosphate kinase